MFQSTHPRRVRPEQGEKPRADRKGFNPRTREGCDGARSTRLRPTSSFNPRTREGCDAARRLRGPRLYRFNPRTREGCDSAPYGSPGIWTCFNPRTRDGCDPSTSCRTRMPLLSFNPRTREGCDWNAISGIPQKIMFQSTHPRRVRLEVVREVVREVQVSIHAPAKGATYVVGRTFVAFMFQSTHPRRVRRGHRHAVLAGAVFQSTHPRRVRPGSARRGRGSTTVSIHAPAKGATTSWSTSATWQRGFNPRTREGCDGAFRVPNMSLTCVSIHAPAKGATNAASAANTAKQFQSTHPRRVRPWSWPMSSYPQSFQSTHPRRVRRSKYTSAVICRGGLCGRRWRYSFMKRSATSDMALSSRFLREPPAALTELEVRAIQLIPISTTSPLDRKLFSHRVVPRDASSSFQDCRREGCPSPRR